jgi:hypothetical protein
VTSLPDDTTASPERKSTEIQDLPAKERNDEVAGDVKGGAAVDPCIRAPRLNVTDREIEPCWRPGNSSAI